MIDTDTIQRSGRFNRGLAVYDVMTANAFHGRLNPGLSAMEREFPFLVDATMAYAIGDVWGRPEMDVQLRELAMIAALGAGGSSGYPQLRQHASYALNLGASADELRELVYLTTVTAGFPRALNMAAEIKAVFDETGVGPGSKSPEPLSGEADRRQRGLDKMADLGHEPAIDLAAHPVLGPLSRDFPFLVDATVDYSMAEVWTRAALDPADRQIATIAAFATLGDAWPQMRLHIGHALRMGVSRTVLKEIVSLLTVSGGFPLALNAAAEMSKVFAAFDQNPEQISSST